MEKSVTVISLEYEQARIVVQVPMVPYMDWGIVVHNLRVKFPGPWKDHLEPEMPVVLVTLDDKGARISSFTTRKELIDAVLNEATSVITRARIQRKLAYAQLPDPTRDAVERLFSQPPFFSVVSVNRAMGSVEFVKDLARMPYTAQMWGAIQSQVASIMSDKQVPRTLLHLPKLPYTLLVLEMAQEPLRYDFATSDELLDSVHSIAVAVSHAQRSGFRVLGRILPDPSRELYVSQYSPHLWFGATKLDPALVAQAV
ncbi:MAG TPA: hypothetical protein VEA59_02310 [Patescibacteria group bacterium]|nr:hypothetical protein [Patescibacteria group bacterium]